MEGIFDSAIQIFDRHGVEVLGSSYRSSISHAESKPPAGEQRDPRGKAERGGSGVGSVGGARFTCEDHDIGVDSFVFKQTWLYLVDEQGA
jgi:hypothetical protein